MERPLSAPGHDHHNHSHPRERDRTPGAQARRCDACRRGRSFGSRIRLRHRCSQGLGTGARSSRLRSRADFPPAWLEAQAADGSRWSLGTALRRRLRQSRREDGVHSEQARTNPASAEPLNEQSKFGGTHSKRRAAAAHPILPNELIKESTAYGVKSDGGAMPSRAAVVQAVRKASTFLFCFRAVCTTDMRRSANRLPRSLCVKVPPFCGHPR